MLTVFWVCRGVLLTEFQQRDHTVTSASYCTILTKLRAAIRRKRPGVLTKGMLLLHENARPDSVNQTTATLRSCKWEVLQHPLYSPDLGPSDFHLFGPPKQHLSGERFPDEDAVERAVCAWFRQQPQEFHAAGFQGLGKRWDKCLICMEITLKNKCCLYVIIPIRFFSITVCNLLIDFLRTFNPHGEITDAKFDRKIWRDEITWKT